MASADPQTLAYIEQLRGDLSFFGGECLTVRTKEGHFKKLLFNRAQQEIHRRLEEQKAEQGWVRALILKGRQQGCSTYVGARFYHTTSLNRGVNTYILTHDQGATDTLFGMVDRYQRNNPIAPHVGASNAKELEFDRLDSSYSVATAGSKAAGRSKALMLFHGSEVAFWPNAPEHFAASVQGVPLVPGTEVILESTSAGAGGEYYERCQDALANKSDYILIFIPWWVTDEYQRDPPPDFKLSDEEIDGEMSEVEYAATYGLNNRQMAWRRSKIAELRSTLLFRREYPATVADAWTAPPGHEPFIDPLMVLRARKRKRIEAVGPLILGVDPASAGGDRFAIAARRGNKVEWVKYRDRLGHEEAVAWVRSLIEELQPARVNIDAGNIGANIVSSLKNLGPQFAQVVRGVNFGGQSEWRFAKPKIPGPYNRRSEMWDRLKHWLESPEGTSLPDDDALQADISAAKQKPRLDGFWVLEAKQDMKKRGIRSPDLADAVALTFAFNEFLPNYHQPAKVAEYGDLTPPAPVEDHVYDGVPGGANSWMG